MFSIAFFSLASMALSALASPLALNGLPSVPDKVEARVGGTVPGVPHVRRHDAVACLTEFLEKFEAPLANVESIVNGAANAQALATAIRPALGDLMTPMTDFVGQVVAGSGVSAQGNTVTVNVQQTVLTVKGFANRLTICLSKASDMVGEDFPEIKSTIQIVGNTFYSVVYAITLVSGFTISHLSPVLNILVPLASKLSVCATSSLGL